MNSAETWVIKTSELFIGSTLRFDLTDADGIVLLKAGKPITQGLIDRLQRRSIHSVTVKCLAVEVPSHSSMLLSYFDSEKIEAVDRIISENEQILRGLALSLEQGKNLELVGLNDNINQFIEIAHADSSAALAVIATRSRSTSPEIVERLMVRSTLMAMTGVTVGCLMDFSEQECIEIGMVGLLHDCSLLIHPEWFGDKGELLSDDATIASFRKHPIESAQLLDGVPGINEQVLQAIVQVHEQFDGLGFPHSLSGAQIHDAASIINAVDAYLNLIDPLFRDHRILPADALAFLCHNAAKGRFAPLVIRGLVMGMSIYPIGSIVELDDESLAIVVSSNQGNPLEPIVRLVSEGSKFTNLSNSTRSIAGPSANNDKALQRLSKSRMDEMLWRCDNQSALPFA